MSEPNRENFEIVAAALKTGIPLNLTMVGRIFGEEFWQLLTITLTGTKIQADKITIIINEK